MRGLLPAHPLRAQRLLCMWFYRRDPPAEVGESRCTKRREGGGLHPGGIGKGGVTCIAGFVMLSVVILNIFGAMGIMRIVILLMTINGDDI